MFIIPKGDKTPEDFWILLLKNFLSEHDFKIINMDEHNHKKEKFRNEDDQTMILTGNKMFARGMP